MSARTETVSRSARQIRRERARRLVLRFSAWVVLPTLIASIYYGCVASPQYESVAVVSVQSAKGAHIGFDGLAAILPMAGGASVRDTMLVREYVRSRTMFERLDKEKQLVAHYKDTSLDWWSRLDEDASMQAGYEYYLDKVSLEHDSSAGTLELRVLAYSPEAAHDFAVAILEDAESMVNAMSKRAQEDRLALSRDELANAEQRLAKARAELVRLQGEGGELDPTKSAAALYRIKAELETELAKVTAELDAARAVLSPNAPEVIQLSRRASSLRRQIGEKARRLAGADGEDLTSSIARLEPALVEKEFAQHAYEAALKATELARVEASGQQRYLITISPPSTPDVATHPKKLWGIARVFFGSLALMGILSLLLASVREHAKL